MSYNRPVGLSVLIHCMLIVFSEPTSFNQNNHNEYIPCQFCDKPIEFKDYVSHQVNLIETFFSHFHLNRWTAVHNQDIK